MYRIYLGEGGRKFDQNSTPNRYFVFFLDRKMKQIKTKRKKLNKNKTKKQN